jgi:glyoxylase-like metal-dependent hydrolase (beta-lactamase superfamily II)
MRGNGHVFCAVRRKPNKLNEAFSIMIPGEPVFLAPGVRRILAGNPGPMTGPGTNTYLLGAREVAVLDPGPDDAAHMRSILAVGGPAIRWIIVTHTHRDHSPLAAALARATGARLIGLPPPEDGRQDESFRPDELPVDGETLNLGKFALRAIHTPGHASNCVCYLLQSERLLFTGDHVLGGVTPVILPPDGDMAKYLNSLDKLAGHDFERIAPGHGLDLVASGRYASIGLADAATAQDRRAAARWPEFFRLRSVAAQRPRELSYGQLRRALIARALAGGARILLLDEPLTGLDPRQRAVVKGLLERLMRKLVTVVIAVHHAEDLPCGMTHGLRLHGRRAHLTDCHSAN